MKNSVVRKVDELGRIVLPAQVRTQLGIECNDNMVLFADENRIIIMKEATDKGCLLS